MADDTTFSCQSNQFDLISVIDSMINESPLVWKWCWVKGHQDKKKKGDKMKRGKKKFIGPLDRWATLNVAMDSAAKRKCQADAMNPPPIQYTLANEMWQLYTGVPEEYMAATKLPSSHKVSTNLDDELKQTIKGDKIIKYWTNYFTIPWDAVKDIDWPA
eukprot:1584350-Ditylum_brightwellii.AAC.1